MEQYLTLPLFIKALLCYFYDLSITWLFDNTVYYNAAYIFVFVLNEPA